LKSNKAAESPALPFYMVALILDFASTALGCLAARIAGDDWPE